METDNTDQKIYPNTTTVNTLYMVAIITWTLYISATMFLRVRHQKVVHVYLILLLILGILVVMGAMIAYHALLREQHFQIQAAVAKFASSDANNQRFGKCIK